MIKSIVAACFTAIYILGYKNRDIMNYTFDIMSSIKGGSK